MWRMSRIEFGLAAAAFLGVALVGVLQGVLVAIGLSFVAVVAQAWQPYRTELVETSDRPGFHDVERHPDGHRIPGLVLVRFDAPLFFANGDIFDNYVRSVVAAAATPVEWVVVAAEPLTGLDTTAVDELVDLDTYLDGKGIRLVFAEMKGPIKDTSHPVRIERAVRCRALLSDRRGGRGRIPQPRPGLNGARGDQPRTVSDFGAGGSGCRIIRSELSRPSSPARIGISRATCRAMGRASVLIRMISASISGG